MKVERICEQQVLANREHFDIASLSVIEKHMEALTPIMERMRSR